METKTQQAPGNAQVIPNQNNPGQGTKYSKLSVACFIIFAFVYIITTVLVSTLCSMDDSSFITLSGHMMCIVHKTDLHTSTASCTRILHLALVSRVCTYQTRAGDRRSKCLVQSFKV